MLSLPVLIWQHLSYWGLYDDQGLILLILIFLLKVTLNKAFLNTKVFEEKMFCVKRITESVTSHMLWVWVELYSVNRSPDCQCTAFLCYFLVLYFSPLKDLIFVFQRLCAEFRHCLYCSVEASTISQSYS